MAEPYSTSQNTFAQSGQGVNPWNPYMSWGSDAGQNWLGGGQSQTRSGTYDIGGGGSTEGDYPVKQGGSGMAGYAAAAGAVAKTAGGMVPGLIGGTGSTPYGPEANALSSAYANQLGVPMMGYQLLDLERARRGKFDPAMQRGIDQAQMMLTGLMPGMASTQFQQQVAPAYSAIDRQFADRGVSAPQMNQLKSDVNTQMALQNAQMQQQGAMQYSDMLANAYGQMSQYATQTPGAMTNQYMQYSARPSHSGIFG